MEEIRIIFFVLSSFFGINDTPMVAEKTLVTINPIEKSIQIEQEHLFTLIQEPSQREVLANRLEQLATENNFWTDDLSVFEDKELIFLVKDNQLNAKIQLRYNQLSDLNIFGLYDNDNTLSMVNIERDAIRTEQGVLQGNYWNFDTAKSFSFSLEPYKNLPQEAQKLRLNLIEVWKDISAQ